MLVHFILLGSVLISFSSYSGKKLFRLSFLFITLFALLRYDYGNDYSSYLKWFEYIQNGRASPYKNEIGFTILNQLIPSFQLLIAVTSAFFLCVIYKMIDRNTDGFYKSLAFLIFIVNPYLFLMNLSAIRQSIALSLFIISLKYARERKLFRYIVMIAFATLFHTTAILLIPVYFIINDKPVNRKQVALIVLALLVLMLESSIVEKITEYGLNFFDNPNYSSYIQEETSNSLRATLLTGVYFIYVAFNIRHLRGYQLVCGKLYLVGLVFGMLAFHYAMFTRVQMYFDIFSIIAIPAIIRYHAKTPTGKWDKLVNLYVFPAVILLIYVLRYYSFFTNPMWSKFATYHTILGA